jgi:hypothetical protein
MMIGGKTVPGGLRLSGLKAEELEAFPANEPRKVVLVRLVWKKTTSSGLNRASPDHLKSPDENRGF